MYYLLCIEFEFSASHIPETEKVQKWVKRPPFEVVMSRFEENCILWPMCLILCLYSGQLIMLVIVIAHAQYHVA